MKVALYLIGLKERSVLKMKRLSYRDYLKINGVPIKYDISTDIGLMEFRNSSINLYKNIYDELDLSPTRIILEIGCHYGAFISYLGQKDIIPDAIDLDKNKIELLKKDNSIKANLFHGDAMDFLDDKQNYYDYIFMNFVLEHIPPDNYVELLKKIQKSLKYGGKLFVTVPNLENPFNLRLRYCEPTHVNGFTIEKLIWAFYVTGFDEIKCSDINKYENQKLNEIKQYFENISKLMEIRTYHGYYSEGILCTGTKIFDLEEIQFGPYDY